MEDNNPYRSLEVAPAAMAAASERAEFLKKVYGILFLGMLGFAATLWGAANVPALHDVAMKLGGLIYGHRWGFLVYLGLFYGGNYAVHALADKRPVNVVAYAAWVVLMGFLLAPLVLYIADAKGMEIVTQASATTALVFLGLTAYVLVSGKDFSFLRGALSIAFWGILVMMAIGFFTSFGVGLFISWALVMFYALYILYDTSKVLHHLPTSMPMTGAIWLFTDVVLLFQNILVLFASNDD